MNTTTVYSISGVEAYQKIALPRMDAICHTLHLGTPVLFNISFRCRDVFDRSNLGTGNWLFLLYALKGAVRAAGNARLELRCEDEEDAPEIRSQLVLPWVMTGGDGSDGDVVPPSENEKAGNLTDFCSSPNSATEYRNQPIELQIPQMRQDLRRMADALQQTHVVEPDEAVIHIRCGDLMVRGHYRYSFFKFYDLARHLHPSTKTIGIVTQPVTGGQNRARDEVDESSGRCQRLVVSLQQYLQTKFPGAVVRIHNNGDTETIATAYTRMILAQQLVASPSSSFSATAAAACVGTAYVPVGRNGWTQWIGRAAVNDDDSHIVMFRPESQALPSAMAAGLWSLPGGEEELLDWFRNDTCPQGYCINSITDEIASLFSSVAA